MATYRHPPIDAIDLPTALSALADPLRIRIVQELSSRDYVLCSDLAEEFGVTMSTMSRHLKALREAGVTRKVADGQHHRTTLRADFAARFPGLLDLVFAAEAPSDIVPSLTSVTER
jgi:DNA-binding transcriptional ArsR family regulator